MIENWSSAKVNVYLEEKDKEIDRLHEEVRTLTEQRDDEEARVKVCVKFLRELLHQYQCRYLCGQFSMILRYFCVLLVAFVG